jgi:tRNA pseudouridine55 synthase
MSANISLRRKAEAVDGLLLLNKPAGITSNQALQKIKRLLNAKKAGHTGSLDPAATGMLPLCFGEATKVCAYLLDADKTYRVTARLGEATDTGDADGKVIDTAPVPPLDLAAWSKIVQGFSGDSEQIPPMYSALKQDGKRLYELARKGITVERKARKIRIHDIQLLEASSIRLVMRVHCSKGTYIRTLVEDIAKAAGTLAHAASLHRENVGDFDADDMLDMSSAAAVAAEGPDALRGKLLPADIALASWAEVAIDAGEAAKFVGGQAVTVPQATEGLVRVYDSQRIFLGVGELASSGLLAPRRIFKQQQQHSTVDG